MAQSTFNVLNGSGVISKGSQSTWTDARDAASGTIDSSDNVASGYSTLRNPVYDNGRFFMGFDTASLPDDAVISDAKIRVYIVSRSGSDAETLNVVSMTSGDPTSLVTTDYVNVGATSFGTLSFGSAATSAYNDIELNASGIAAISLISTTKFAFRTTRDINNTTPNVDQSSGNSLNIDHSTGSGATFVMELVVTYKVPSAGAFLLNFI